MLDNARCGMGCCIPVLPTTMIRPHFCARIAGSSRLAMRMGETMTWNHATRSSSVI